MTRLDVDHVVGDLAQALARVRERSDRFTPTRQRSAELSCLEKSTVRTPLSQSA